jgi:hypothetical protein
MIAIGKTNIAVGKGYRFISKLINNQHKRIELIAPNDINSP